MPEHVWGDMYVYGGEGGVFVYHTADGLVGEFFAVLICEEVAAVLDFGFEIVFVFFEDADDGVASYLDFTFFGAFSVN